MYPSQLSNLISLHPATLAFFLLSNHDDLPTWPEGRSLLGCFPSDLSVVDFFYHFDLSLDTPQRITLSHFSILFTALISLFLLFLFFFFLSVLFIEESPVSRIDLDILNRC